MPQPVVYLHGFQSAPSSDKAQQTKRYFEQYHSDVSLVIPAIPNQPAKLRGFLEQLITDYQLFVGEGARVIGSSMGGYLATWLVESCGGKAVLINPAVKPYELLQDYLGEHENPYTGDMFELKQRDMTHIADLDTPKVRQPDAYRVLLQTGDKTLDYRQAETKYQGGNLVIEQGGDHSFVNYSAHLPAICAFLLG